MWISRDGTVDTPDHDHIHDSVITALGGQLNHPCAYWASAGRATLPQLPSSATPPGLLNWTVDLVATSWTSRSVWTAVGAIAGDLTFSTIDPKACLEFAQVFTRHGQMPAQFPEHAQQLLAPATRPAGFRRTRATTAAELDDLLAAGISGNLAAGAAALDFDADTLARGLTQLARLSMPPATLLILAGVLPPAETVDLLCALDRESVSRTVHQLPALSSREGNLSLDELFAALGAREV